MTDDFTRTYELGRSLGIELGKHQEQERIIELLEEAKVINTDHKFFLIKAIKGEQK